MIGLMVCWFGGLGAPLVITRQKGYNHGRETVPNLMFPSSADRKCRGGI